MQPLAPPASLRPREALRPGRNTGGVTSAAQATREYSRGAATVANPASRELDLAAARLARRTHRQHGASGPLQTHRLSWQCATSVTPASASILKVMYLYARFSLSLANSSLHLSVGNTPGHGGGGVTPPLSGSRSDPSSHKRRGLLSRGEAFLAVPLLSIKSGLTVDSVDSIEVSSTDTLDQRFPSREC